MAVTDVQAPLPQAQLPMVRTFARGDAKRGGRMSCVDRSVEGHSYSTGNLETRRTDVLLRSVWRVSDGKSKRILGRLADWRD